MSKDKVIAIVDRAEVESQPWPKSWHGPRTSLYRYWCDV